MLKWLWLSVVCIFLDQITKYMAEFHLNETIVVNPFFNIVLAHNEGAAFSILSDAGGWQRWFFIVLASLVSIVLIVWLKKIPLNEKWQAISLAMIIGGAIGNVIDRSIYGYVIDFIQVHYQDWYWPAFNVADSVITMGVVLMLLDEYILKRKKDSLEIARNK
ncbi:MAG: lipoprotein signal peptidase [Methylococcales bacterium]|jgi:signal peptidase II|nr:lipoprotein signal peptidase [Methylococcales bacterium]